VRYVVQTFGCQMNAHDSDRLEAVLRAHGWEPASAVHEADLVVLNTCSVREKAEQKLRSEVGKLTPLKRARPDLVIAIAGCVAQQEGEKLLTRMPHVDIVLGPDNVAELPELVLEQRAGALPVARAEFDLATPRFLRAEPEPGAAPVAAMVTTMKGCDERCSFCVVPYTRGPERYRPAAEIVDEIARWVDAGAREVLLLGQTVDSYRDASLASAAPPEVPRAPRDADHPDDSQFPALLRAIARDVPRLLRLRYTSPHPRHATTSLARAHAELDVLARHVHLPAQSGSDRVLKRMIRRYTRAEYTERARRLLAARSGMTLSTDLIVGFPGETDDDFAQTLDLVRDVGFVAAYAFKFSPRPFTPALKLSDDVPEEVKSARLAELLELVEAQGRAHLAALVGTRQKVLVEGRSKTGNSFEGRTDRNEIVHVETPAPHASTGAPRDPGAELVGEEVRVDIARANKHSLVGVLAPGEAERVAQRTGARPRPAKRRRLLPLILE
jgi:tRNA-2-methylthio-N6-dimethylallyladenosine synthase